MAYIGRQLARGENKLFDDISSSFNGSTTAFNLTVSSVATATATPDQLFVSLGGVMQKPNTDFTTAGNQITFTTAPAAGLSCWIMMQGDAVNSASVSDASITPSKIGSGDFAFPNDVRLKDSDGSHYVGFQAPTTVSTNKIWTLPAADGSANQYLKTNGSGTLSWGNDANAPEGTAVLSTGETGTTKYLRVDGDNTCSWQLAVDATKMPLAGGTFTDDVAFTGAAGNIQWDKSDNALEILDSAKIKIGTGDDLQIHSDGSRGIITGSVSNVATAVSALDLDLRTSNYFTKTISGNSTFTFSNPAASGTASIFMLELTHSSGTVTWPGTVKWNGDTAPTLTTGKTHLFMFVTDDGGSRYRGSALVDYVN